MSSFCTGALAPILCLAAAVAALIQANPGSIKGPVAALFPPWWQAADVFKAAGTAGRIVRFGTVRFVVIVASEDPKVAERLRAAGAILVTDPLVVGGCSSASASFSG